MPIKWNNVDTYRKAHMAVAELVDAWRVIPRLLVAAYSYLIFMIVKWYMDLGPTIIEGCVSDTITDCIHQAPTTQQAALVTTIVGISAAVFGLYTNTGRKWNGFTHWNREDDRDGDGIVDAKQKELAKLKAAQEKDSE